MESDYLERINALTEEYKRSLKKKKFSALNDFDIDQYKAVSCVVVSTDVQHYASSSVSGGGGFVYNGTGFSGNSSISSSTEHHVKNEAWLICLENDAEFKLKLPADFDVREGHTIVLFGYYANENETSFVLERYYNLVTSQFALEAGGLFNRSTIYNTSKIPRLSYLLMIIPIVGLLYPLVNLSCVYPKLPHLLKKYYRVFYSSLKNWLIIISEILLIYVFFTYGDKLNALIKLKVVHLLIITYAFFLIVPIYIRIKRKMRVAKFINLHIGYINSALPIYAECIINNTVILEQAQKIYLKNSNAGQSVDNSQSETKECPEWC